MVQNNAVNINRLNLASNEQKDRIDALFTRLAEEDSMKRSSNAFHRSYGFFEVVWTLIFLAGSVLLFIKRDIVRETVTERLKDAGMSARDRDVLIPNLEQITGVLLLLIVIICGSNLLRMIYNAMLARRTTRIKSCRKTAEKRAAAKDMPSFTSAVITAVEEGKGDFSADHKNDLGNRISSIRDDMEKSNRRARIMKAVISPVFSAVYYLFGFVIMWLLKDKLAADSFFTYVWLTLFGTYTYFAIDVVLCSIGGYLGKYMRPFGCLLAAGYAGFLWYLITGIDGGLFGNSVLTNNSAEVLLPQLKASYVVVLLQFIAMAAGILSGDYLGMKEKWEKSFVVTLQYGGSGRERTRGSVIRRMLWSSMWVILSWVVGTQVKADISIAVFVYVWWRAMPLFKPFGSVIYDFFGRGKSISMELMSFAVLIMHFLRLYGTISLKELLIIGISLVVYIIFGIVIKAVNDITELFAFMHFFV